MRDEMCIRRSVSDFEIFQRDREGYADIFFDGSLPCDAVETGRVFARVTREDSNLVVIPWTECELSENRRDWSVTLRVPQGGLYCIEGYYASEYTPGVTQLEWSAHIKNIEHVGVGDVFVTAGQSNMSGYGRDFAYDPPVLGVHMFANDGSWRIASNPATYIYGDIYPGAEGCSGTGPALSFARTVSREIGLPVGLVPCSIGATGLPSWNPLQVGVNFDMMVNKCRASGCNGFTGILWYQGCSDATPDTPDKYENYLASFTEMIREWRARYFGEDMPVITAQLNRQALDEPEHIGWSKVKEAQRRAAKTIPGVYVIPTLDMPSGDGIHNTSGANVIIGERMASAFLRMHYGKPGMTAPNLDRVIRKSDTDFILVFDEQREMRAFASTKGLYFLSGDDRIDAQGAELTEEGVLVRTERAVPRGAVFCAYTGSEPEAFILRDALGMPMLACYGVEVEE